MKNLTFLFWNLYKNNLVVTLKDIIEHHDVDVVVLAECTFRTEELVYSLNEKQSFYFPENGLAECKKIRIITKFNPKFLTPIYEEERFSIRKLTVSDNEHILIAGVHIPDKSHDDADNQLMICQRLRDSIEEMEKEHSTDKTLILGDFNMNPFETGLVSAVGLNAVMSERIAQTGSRIVNNKIYPYFYNPMWSLFGDIGNNVEGSYFYRKNANFPWNVFDQVLLRPSLIHNFDKDSLKFLDYTGKESILTEQMQYPNKKYSDHLPLIFKLKLK
jgi:exonuclease III